MKAEAPNIMQTIATTLAIVTSMTILIPFLLKLFIKPMIRDEIDKVQQLLDAYRKEQDAALLEHIRVDHGYEERRASRVRRNNR